jgi:phospholipid-translocating ATPase
MLLEGNTPAEVGQNLMQHLTAIHKLKVKAEHVLVVQGTQLGIAAEHHRAAVCRLMCISNAVVICRVTPAQKAIAVRMLQDAGNTVVAIGDGGNDVAMIQEADVGVGIRGKEGLQAARGADFQVSYFRDVKQLLLVHGRQSYMRTALVAQYSFYKSFLFCLIQITYGFFSQVCIRVCVCIIQITYGLFLQVCVCVCKV